MPKTAQNSGKQPKPVIFHDFTNSEMDLKHTFSSILNPAMKEGMTSGVGWEPIGQHIIHIYHW